jgi:galactokinase
VVRTHPLDDVGERRDDVRPSAALEVAAGRAFAAAAGVDPTAVDPLELALTGRRVENEVFGLGSGIMDQLVSAIDRPGSAVLID